MPDGEGLEVYARRRMSTDESKGALSLGITYTAVVDKNLDFAIEGMRPGEYELSTFLISIRGAESVNSQGSNQRVAVSENDETSVTIDIDLSKIKRPQQQRERQLKR